MSAPMAGRFSLGNWRVAGLCLALIALVLKAAIPAGFMLSPTPGGILEITLCGGNGPQTAIIDLRSDAEKQQHGSNENDAKDQPCAFAVAAVAAPAPDAVSFAAPLLVAYAALLLTARDERPSLLPAGPPLPARGPPSLA
jgi:hypothetical protein